LVTDLVISRYSLTMEKGTILRWLKKEGDPVKKGEPIVVEIEADKVTTEVESPASSVLLKILAREGTEVPVNKPIAFIGKPGEPIPKIEAVSEETVTETERAEMGYLAVEHLKRGRRQGSCFTAGEKDRKGSRDRYHSGPWNRPGGKITKDDVLRFIERYRDTRAVEEILPMKGMQKTIAERMIRSLRTAVHCSITIEVDASRMKKREEWLRGIEPIPYAALHFSQNTRDFYWRDNPHGYHAGYLAAYKVLLESHVPFSCIFDKNLDLKQLSRFKVLVLPNSACLTVEQADVIRKYVKQGGGLVATYKTSLCNEFGDERSNFALNDLFGVDYFEPLGYSNSYIKLTAQHKVTEGVDSGMPLLITEPQLKVRLHKDRTAVGTIVLPITEVIPKQRWFTHGNPPPSKETAYPAIVAGNYGKGRVVYFASPLEQVIHSKAYPYAEKLLANAIRWAGGEPPVTAKAPVSVELTAFKQPAKNRIVVHLVNFQSQPGRSLPEGPIGVFSEVIPVHNLEVTIKVPDSKKVKDVYLAPEREKALFRSIDGGVTVSIPEVKIHRMVVLETK